MHRFRTVLASTLAASTLATANAAHAQTAQQAASSANDFGFDAFRRAGSATNTALSPTSLHLALALTWAGASGVNASEMARVLHLGTDASAAQRGIADLASAFARPSHPGSYQLDVANRLWGERSLTFGPAFLQIARDRFGAPLESIDWRHHAEAGRLAVNAWVAGQTHDRIRDLLPPGAVDETTRMVLTNAVYFHGRWAHRFETRDTHDADFHVTAARTVRVPTMSQHGSFALGAIPGGHMLELPYQGDDLVMDVLLPDRVDGLAALQSSLNDAALRGWVGSLHTQPTHVVLPRFHIEANIAAGNVLQAMGMRAAFRCTVGTFDVMSPSAQLCISAVFHRVFVDVNEEGTEAAAATGVVMNITGMPPPPAEFVADHPFLFAIRDVRNGAVLFIGRVGDPSVH